MLLLKDKFGIDMMFYTFDDFMKRKDYIKDCYWKKDEDYKISYQLYIESRPWLKEYHRLCIWDWINDYMTDEELSSVYDKYLEKYGHQYE